MKKSGFEDTFVSLCKETSQAAELRLPYLKAITKARGGRTVVSFFISFWSPAPLMQEDADQLEEILCNAKISDGITLLLDAPGGDGLAAERIIRICKAYSKGDFEAIVAARAKSAATMICLGADRILMSPTSELGPIDPQVPMDLTGTDSPEWVAAHHITKAYDELFKGAEALSQGHIEPYLQQLSKFNAVKISQLKSASKLAEDIAINSLKNGMLKNLSTDEIREKIKPFTDPELTMAHGRGISHLKATECGLNVELLDLHSDIWKAIWGLHVRSKHVVDSSKANKLIDTINGSFVA